MPVPFIMPKFDMDQEEATIASWEKKEGDYIKAEETVLIVETSKVAIDVPAPDSGTLVGIRYKQGDTVPVTTVIAYILKAGETLADLPKEAPTVVKHEMPVAAASVPAMAVAQPAPVAITPVVTPVAARLAKDKGVDLSKVAPTGERVTREDVERYLAANKPSGSTPVPTSRVVIPATPAARRIARETGVSLDGIQGSGPRGRVQAADVSSAASLPRPLASADGDRPVQIVPLAGIRRKIAERMTASFHDIPHISLTVEADATALEAARLSLSSMAATQGAGKVSLTALLVKVIAWALERNPYVNASLDSDQIQLWQDVNIGVATALPDGLIVPVIHHANEEPVRNIAAALADLTQRAKDGKLTLADVQHATFTISNLGMYGIHQFRAVINPPESAILAVGAVERRPVVINDRDDVAVRPILTLTLSADHRVIDGVVAARFLQDLVQAIEVPASLLY
jgi:pyruvate dehydrogenase E2 component (dihydrolipoamide acetyltransferase)